MKNYLLWILFTGCICSSCNKEEAATTPAHEPLITFISPAALQEVNENDTLWIRLSISSEDDLHEYLVQVRDIAADKIIYSYEGHSHAKSAAVDVYMLPDVSTNTEMQLIVTTLDHNSNKSSKSISFKVLNTVNSPRPVITLLSPLALMYSDGEKVNIKGYVMHETSLRDVRVSLFQNNAEMLSFQAQIIQKDSVAFDTSYTIQSPGYSDFELVVTATDEPGQSSVKTHTFHVHK